MSRNSDRRHTAEDDDAEPARGGKREPTPDAIVHDRTSRPRESG